MEHVFPVVGKQLNRPLWRIWKDRVMASADYKLCDVCNRKAFYDATIQDMAYLATYDKSIISVKPIGIKVLCGDCAETHDINIIERTP